MLVDLALGYAARGWPVFPLEPRQKRPCGRLVPHGLQQATTDPDQIRSWWAAEPEANIGLRTGDVFDVADLGSSALQMFDVLAREHELDLRTLPRVKTGKGGRHVLFAPTGLGNRARLMDMDFDWRGKGGYIVAPGSIHPDTGAEYEWIAEPNGTLPVAPDWLVTILRPKAAPEPQDDGHARQREAPTSYVAAAVDAEIQALRASREGERNDTLNRAAFALGQLVGAGWLLRRAAVLELQAAAASVGLDDRETMRTIRSGLEAGMADPRQPPPGGFSQAETGGDIRHGTVEAEVVPVEPIRPLEPDAPSADLFHGLTARMTGLIEPYVESNDISVFTQFLVAFGIAVGTGPHFMVGATRHAPTLYLGLVGQTSRARKGTSWDPVESLFRRADPAFAQRVMSGVGSGERLVYLVRDSRSEEDKEGNTKVVDPGATDRRLLLQEPELARLLTVVNREGSTMSAYLRSAYDGKPLRNEVKTGGSIASSHHIGLVGHCTTDDLVGQLREQEIRNGLANRIVWITAHRARKLADPPIFAGSDIEDAATELRVVLDRAKRVRLMRRHAAAQRIWNEWYLALPDGGMGMLDAITSRRESLVIRASMVFALTDASEIIGVDHLRAAMALDEFSMRCAGYIFGGSTGHAVADRILEELRTGPLTKTEISSELFQRNVSATVLLEAQRILERRGLLVRERVSVGRGRPSERWRIP